MNPKTKHTAGQQTALRHAFDMQVEICKRAEREIKGYAHSRTSMLMDLDSVPNLDLDKLLRAPAFDFAHDICGIIRHMDRSQYPGTLRDCFVPRCCKQGVSA